MAGCHSARVKPLFLAVTGFLPSCCFDILDTTIRKGVVMVSYYAATTKKKTPNVFLSEARYRAIPGQRCSIIF